MKKTLINKKQLLLIRAGMELSKTNDVQANESGSKACHPPPGQDMCW